MIIVRAEFMLEVVPDHPSNAWVHVEFAQIFWKLRCSNSTKHCSTHVINIQESPVYQHWKEIKRERKLCQFPMEVLRRFFMILHSLYTRNTIIAVHLILNGKHIEEAVVILYKVLKVQDESHFFNVSNQKN
jgi:hypothetical protein